jgi:hypothetical protein
MVRQVLAVLLGFLTWSAIWLAGNQLLVELHVLPHGSRTPIKDSGGLLSLLTNAVVATLAAGYSVALLKPPTLQKPVLVLAALLIAVGVVVQSGLWDLMPLWYHVAFLALLLPMCIAGAKLFKSSLRLGRRRSRSVDHQAP